MHRMKNHPFLFGITLALYFSIFFFSQSLAEPPTRLQKCIACCSSKKAVCLNLNPDRRLCAALYEECVATCRTAGRTSSEWSECWPQSE